MAAEVDPKLCERSDDSSTEDESTAVHINSKHTDKPTPARDKKPHTRRSSKSADKCLELPEEIPDSQESLDLSETSDQSPGESFQTEDTVILEGGTKITAKPEPKYVSLESIIFAVELFSWPSFYRLLHLIRLARITSNIELYTHLFRGLVTS